MIRRPPRSTHCISSAASDVYKRQPGNPVIRSHILHAISIGVNVGRRFRNNNVLNWLAHKKLVESGQKARGDDGSFASLMRRAARSGVCPDPGLVLIICILRGAWRFDRVAPSKSGAAIHAWKCRASEHIHPSLKPRPPFGW